ncbi:hypothetical protein ACFLRB_05630 [Acidobacteriota bacterium]
MSKENTGRKTGWLFLIGFLFVFFAGQIGAEDPRWISFSDLSGYLTLNYQATEEKSYLEEEIKSDISRGFFEGGFQVATRGSIYHPNLLSFSIDANIVGNRTKTAFFSDAEINNSLNNSYNILFSFLKRKSFNFQIYTMSHYITAERRFFGRFFTDHKNTGINVSSSTKMFPFKLAVSRIRNSTRGIAFSEKKEDSREVDLRVTLFRKKRTGSFFTFKRKNYEEEIYGVNYDSTEMLADFRHYYGINASNNVISMLSYNNMTGSFDFEIFRLLLNNRHYLKKNLYLGGSYNLVKDNTLDSNSSKQTVRNALNHRLFESLNSSVFLGGRIEDSLYQRRDVFLKGFTVNYRKKIPTGSLNIDYHLEGEDSRFTSHGDIVTTGETYHFDFSDTIQIVQVGIDVESIRISDPTFSLVYIADVDYQAHVIENAVIITRLPGGNIPEGAAVVVYYSYLSFPDFDMDTNYYRFNGQVLFLKYFRIYYNKSSRQHHISSQFLVPPFESFERDVAGVKIDTRYFKAEYSLEKYDSTLSSSYESRNFRASASANILGNLRFSGYASLNDRNYIGSSYYNKFNTLSANLSYNPSANLRAQTGYRSISFETPDYLRSRKSLLFRGQWTIRKIILEILYEHILEGYDISERLHDYLSLMIRRRF